MAKKYKQPTNEKHKPRKDLKDYTTPDVEGMVPDATGKPIPGGLRKIKYEDILDDENMVHKTKDSNIAYPIKDLQDGDAKLPKHAEKVFEKNVKEDADNFIDTVSKIDGGYTSQLKKLTKEQKERVVREYVRRKISKLLKEAEEVEDTEEPLADTPEPTPAPDAPSIPADASTSPAPPVAEVPPPPDDAAPDDVATDDTATVDAEEDTTPPTERAEFTKFVELLSRQGGQVNDVNLALRALSSAISNHSVQNQQAKVNRLFMKAKELKQQVDANIPTPESDDTDSNEITYA